MDQLMQSLYSIFEPLLEAKWFTSLMSVIIIANPIALAPQVIAVFIAESVAGISLMMWYIFAVIQLAFTFHGIKTKSPAIFISMFLSFLELATVIAVVYIRS